MKMCPSTEGIKHLEKCVYYRTGGSDVSSSNTSTIYNRQFIVLLKVFELYSAFWSVHNHLTGFIKRQQYSTYRASGLGKMKTKQQKKCTQLFSLRSTMKVIFVLPTYSSRITPTFLLYHVIFGQSKYMRDSVVYHELIPCVQSFD